MPFLKKFYDKLKDWRKKNQYSFSYSNDFTHFSNVKNFQQNKKLDFRIGLSQRPKPEKLKPTKTIDGNNISNE